MTKREAQRLAILINKHPGCTVTGVRRFPTHGGYSHELVITDTSVPGTIDSFIIKDREAWLEHVRATEMDVSALWEAKS